MLDRIATFVIRFLATFLQFFIITLISKQNNSDLLAFYFLYVAVHQVGSYSLNFGFERIAFISISKNKSNLLKSLNEVFNRYVKSLLKNFYILILLLIANIYLFDIEIFQYFLITICCLLFSINLIVGQSIVASNSPNSGIFFVRVFYLMIISLILSYYHFFELNISKSIIIYSFLLSTILSLSVSYLYIKTNFNSKNKLKPNTTIEVSYDQYKIQLSNIIFQRLPIFLLNIFFIDKIAIAAFSLIHSFATIRGTIVDILGSQLIPNFLNMYENKMKPKILKKYFKKMQLYTLLINTIYGLLILLFGKQILNFFNSDFLDFFSVLTIYIFGNIILSFFGLSIFLNSTISIKNTNHIKNILLSILSMIIFGYLFNEIFGIHGLVIGVLLSQLLLSILSYKNILKLLK